MPRTAGHKTERKFCTFQTEGSNAYSAASGTKIIRCRLASGGDPSTVRFLIEVVNTDADAATKQSKPLGKRHAFFRRCRALVRGGVVEDIFDYNRVSDMFDIHKNPTSYKNDQVESFNLPNDIMEKARLGTPDLQRDAMPAITDKVTVTFKPVSGSCLQSKYINLKYCPIELEFELCSDATEPIKSAISSSIATANTSMSWRFENCVIKADVVQIDDFWQKRRASMKCRWS